MVENTDVDNEITVFFAVDTATATAVAVAIILMYLLMM